MTDWCRIHSIFDPQLGLLLTPTIHKMINNGGMGILRVSVFAFTFGLCNDDITGTKHWHAIST